MGNHAGKDNIGHTGSPLDFFQTPPSSPSEDGHLGALASASSSVFTNKMQTTRCPTSSTPSHCLPLRPIHGEWALINMESPPPPVETSLSRGKEKEDEEEEARTRRCRPSDGALSPAPLPPSCSLPAERSWQEKDSGLESQLEAEQVGQETGLVMLSLMEYYRASLGLSPGARDDAAGAVELLRRLVSERGELVEEVLSLKETLRTERAEWRQFQRDLQVAVSVADRLRVEAEQALGALREQHGTAEARLAQALRRQQEQDGEMRELQAQHRDAHHQLSALRGEGRWRRGEPCESDTQTSTCVVARDGTAPEEENVVGNQPLEKEEVEEEKGHDGREEGKQGSCSLVAAGEKDSEEEKAVEEVRADAESQDEEGHRTAQQSCAGDRETHCSVGSLGDEEGDPRSKKETQLTGKGVAEAYIRRLAATKKTADPRRIVMLSERSWSLSRLPVTDNDDKNRPSPNSSATLPLCKKEEPVKGAKMTRLLQRQDSWSSFSSKKQDEDQTTESIRSAGGALLVTPKSQLVTKGDQAISIRAPTQWNSLPTELRPQDGFSVMLRRHGGSRRNALLRWCQTRTQGYKNIEITNFSSSWEDGLAFCAVYHTYLPSHIPYGTLTPEDKKGNLNLAFQTGSSIGITVTLTVEEMLEAGGPNWQRVLGYVEGIFRHFEM